MKIRINLAALVSVLLFTAVVVGAVTTYICSRPLPTEAKEKAAITLPAAAVSYEPQEASADTEPQASADAADEVIAVPEPTAETLIVESAKSYKGIFEGDIISGELTYYDVCIQCCGKLDGVTASGLVIRNGVEPEIPVASCNWLPFGTLLDVNGTTYIVADRGGNSLNRIGRLDLFEPGGHQAALENGRIHDAEIVVVSLP